MQDMTKFYQNAHNFPNDVILLTST